MKNHKKNHKKQPPGVLDILRIKATFDVPVRYKQLFALMTAYAELGREIPLPSFLTSEQRLFWELCRSKVCAENSLLDKQAEDFRIERLYIPTPKGYKIWETKYGREE